MADCGPPYAFGTHDGQGGGPRLIDPGPVLRAVAADVRAGTGARTIAARFHHAVAAAVLDACRVAERDTGVRTVALTGGVFANALLDEACTTLLGASGFTVVRHTAVPCGDGGLALGQVLVAGRFLRERRPAPGRPERRSPCAWQCPAKWSALKNGTAPAWPGSTSGER
ncbi:hypothetical protein GCM10020000_01080 [Streptomyces olivoverticillatus]